MQNNSRTRFTNLPDKVLERILKYTFMVDSVVLSAVLPEREKLFKKRDKDMQKLCINLPFKFNYDLSNESIIRPQVFLLLIEKKGLLIRWLSIHLVYETTSRYHTYSSVNVPDVDYRLPSITLQIDGNHYKCRCNILFILDALTQYCSHLTRFSLLLQANKEVDQVLHGVQNLLMSNKYITKINFYECLFPNWDMLSYFPPSTNDIFIRARYPEKVYQKSFNFSRMFSSEMPSLRTCEIYDRNPGKVGFYVYILCRLYSDAPSLSYITLGAQHLNEHYVYYLNRLNARFRMLEFQNR